MFPEIPEQSEGCLVFNSSPKKFGKHSFHFFAPLANNLVCPPLSHVVCFLGWVFYYTWSNFSHLVDDVPTRIAKIKPVWKAASLCSFSIFSVRFASSLSAFHAWFWWRIWSPARKIPAQISFWSRYFPLEICLGYQSTFFVPRIKLCSISSVLSFYVMYSWQFSGKETTTSVSSLSYCIGQILMFLSA